MVRHWVTWPVGSRPLQIYVESGTNRDRDPRMEERQIHLAATRRHGMATWLS
jgi:hypothetical protein